jgi:hypothetical protein
MTEISTKLKSDYKGGVDHKVFFSKKYPDKLFKVGPKRSIDRWFDIFNSNSQIFPKVYYRKQLKGNEWKNFATFFDDLQDTQYDYVLIERLNTDDFEKFWLELDNALVYILDEDDIDQDVDLELISFEYKTNPEYKKIWIELLEFLKKNKPHLYDRAVELHEIIKTLHKVKEFPDIHMFQFGIDSSGKIKALDI